jgi:hypothetical protein
MKGVIEKFCPVESGGGMARSRAVLVFALSTLQAILASRGCPQMQGAAGPKLCFCDNTSSHLVVKLWFGRHTPRRCASCLSRMCPSIAKVDEVLGPRRPPKPSKSSGRILQTKGEGSRGGSRSIIT